MKIWAKTKEWAEGKFLVVRRDGTVPHWPHFVLGARDKWAPTALRAYAFAIKDAGGDAEYADSILELATDFENYRFEHGNGDPESGPHRKDDPAVIAAMRAPGGRVVIGDGNNPDKFDVPGFDVTDRMLKHFRFEHLPAFLQEVSKPFGKLARHMCEVLPMSAERTVMLRKLVESKDCAVRAHLEAKETREALGLTEAERPD